MVDLFPTLSIREERALDVLERVLMELLQSQGFSGGSLHSEVLSIEELVARDGGLPVFVAQAAIWSQIMGVPHVVSPFDLVNDDAALTCTRAVIDGSDESQEERPGAPLLLFMDHAIHVVRSGSASQTLALEALIQSPNSGISDALSRRRWPVPRGI